jgi:serine/threonine protein kinase
MSPLAPGTAIDGYRLEHLLGEGGMGSVYQAQDAKLHRAVAIKFLSNDLADASARRRFQREARLASSLNHPHILTVHDTGEFDGRQYIVTELADGGTLRDWLRAGQRSWMDIVELLIGVADAIAVAHEAGILHRDIKPENILLVKSGYAKLADFGLAKMYEPPSIAADAVTETRTRAGAVVGTVGYMSPEQATGLAVDAQSDVFSFAIVLYEMLAGRRPFKGKSDLDVLHAIAHQPPEPLPAALPEPLRTLIDRGLRKDPADRATMKEFVREMRLLVRQSDGAPHRTRNLAWAALALALAIFAAVIAVKSRTSSQPVSTEYIQLTNFADSAVSPALSPDGTMLAFIKGPSTFFTPGQIFVKRLPDGEAVQLTNDPAFKFDPKFTVDGKSVSYATGSGGGSPSMDTWIVPAAGGEPPREILKNAEGLTWFRNHASEQRALFSEMTGLGGQMSIVTATDTRGDPRDVYVPPPPAGMAHRSALAPDGKSVLIVEMDLDSWLPCRLVPFDGKSTGRIVGPSPSQCTYAAWSPDGNWMYFTAQTANGTHIWRQRYPDGPPEQLTFSAVSEEGVHVAPDGRSFVTSIGSSQSTLWVHDAKGDRQITSEGFSFMPTISPDLKKLYYLVRAQGARSWNHGSLWVADLETRQRQNLFAGYEIQHYTVSADGRRIVFVTVDDQGTSPLWIASLDPPSAPRQLTTIDVSLAYFGADGEVLFSSNGDTLNIYRVKEDGSDLRKMITTPLIPLAASPDGRWIAVQDPSAWGALFLHSLDGGKPRRLCDLCAPPWGVDTIPFFFGWAPDGRHLYWSHSNSLVAIPLTSGQMLPPIPADGIQSPEGVAAMAGARVVSTQEHTFPGPNPSTYAFMKVTTQRNIFRVPVR